MALLTEETPAESESNTQQVEERAYSPTERLRYAPNARRFYAPELDVLVRCLFDGVLPAHRDAIYIC